MQDSGTPAALKTAAKTTKDSVVQLPASAPPAVQRVVEHLGSVLARVLARVDLPRLPEGYESKGDLPVVFIGNHRSVFDVLLGMRMVRRWNSPARMMVKADFFERRGLGTLLRMLGAISVGNGRGAKLAFDQAAEALRRGESIIIMPEARIVPAAERPFGTGDLVSTLGRLVAVRPCVVAVSGLVGADDVWPVGRGIPRLRLWNRPRVLIRSTTFLGLHDLGHREITSRLQTELREMVARVEDSWSNVAPTSANA